MQNILNYNNEITTQISYTVVTNLIQSSGAAQFHRITILLDLTSGSGPATDIQHCG